MKNTVWVYFDSKLKTVFLSRTKPHKKYWKGPNWVGSTDINKWDMRFEVMDGVIVHTAMKILK